ncbi:MAG: GNAT family N-acetyltransferase [Acetobacteraceae bacterium]|nr:GNAT family N-acetyltransferase [Acetobacteraceae bacterium]
MAEALLAEAQLPRAQALSALVGWNQTEADWQLFLRHGQVRALDDGGPALPATAAALRFDARLAWISMVLVRPDRRRQGLATELMRWAMRAAGRETVALDATPAGREVYTRLGFRDAWGLARWRLPAAPAGTAVPVRPLTEADWLTVDALDAEAFGAPRPWLLRNFHARMPHAAFVAPGGFVLARDGHRLPQIGPLVAPDAATALALLAAAQRAIGGLCLMDLRDDAPGIAAACAAAGAMRERPFTRMTLGAALPGNAALGPLLAGPEFG